MSVQLRSITWKKACLFLLINTYYLIAIPVVIIAIVVNIVITVIIIFIIPWAWVRDYILLFRMDVIANPCSDSINPS